MPATLPEQLPALWSFGPMAIAMVDPRLARECTGRYSDWAMEPFKRRCPFCGDPAELAMARGPATTPKVHYDCKACSRTFALLPTNVRKALVAVVILSALVVAGGGWVLTMDTGSARHEARALRLVVGGLIPFLGTVILLGRDALRRRASPVISRF